MGGQPAPHLPAFPSRISAPISSRERGRIHSSGGTVMRRIAATGLLILIPVLVFAANAHFISGPTISEHNGSLEVCGSIAGLGNQDVTIQVSATADVQCVNRGGNPPPGQRQTVSGSVSNLRTENGRVD